MWSLGMIVREGRWLFDMEKSVEMKGSGLVDIPFLATHEIFGHFPSVRMVESIRGITGS